MDEINVPFDSGNSFEENKVSHHKKNNPNRLIAGLIILFLIIALPAALFLSQSSQDIRQRAQTYCIANLVCTNDSETCCPGTNKVVDLACPEGRRCSSVLGLCTTVNDGSNCVGRNPGESCIRGGRGGTCGAVSGSIDVCTCVLPSENSCETNGGTCYYGYTDCFPLHLTNAPPSMSCPQDPGSPLFNLCCIAGPSCSCGPWTPGQCGAAGGCATGSRNRTRVCTPSGCNSVSECVPDSTCPGAPSPSPTPPGLCDGGCTWKIDNTCNIGSCLGTCTRRTAFCESNTNPGVNCQQDQCISDNSCSTSCNPPQPSPSATPVAAAQCTAVNIYRLIVNGTTCATEDVNNAACWVLQNAANPMPIGPGSKIYISTKGVPQNGATINQARIQVALNGAAYAPWVQATHGTTQTKPGTTNEYYIAYTIPTTATATTTFRIGAEVYSPQLDTPANTPWNGDNLGWR